MGSQHSNNPHAASCGTDAAVAAASHVQQPAAKPLPSSPAALVNGPTPQRRPVVDATLLLSWQRMWQLAARAGSAHLERRARGHNPQARMVRHLAAGVDQHELHLERGVIKGVVSRVHWLHANSKLAVSSPWSKRRWRRRSAARRPTWKYRAWTVTSQTTAPLPVVSME